MQLRNTNSSTTSSDINVPTVTEYATIVQEQIRRSDKSIPELFEQLAITDSFHASLNPNLCKTEEVDRPGDGQLQPHGCGAKGITDTDPYHFKV